MSADKPDLAFDEYEIIRDEAKYIYENKEDFPWIAEEGRMKNTLDEIQDALYDHDPGFIIDGYLEMMMESLQEHIDKISKKYKYQCYWTAEVSGFGWKGQSGEMDIFEEDDANEIIQKILPQTQNTFKIWFTKKGFKLQNFHHDAPTGNEWYYVEHVTLKELHAWDSDFE